MISFTFVFGVKIGAVGGITRVSEVIVVELEAITGVEIAAAAAGVELGATRLR